VDPNQRPLATSSPPGKRKEEQDKLSSLSGVKPRFPTPTGPSRGETTPPVHPSRVSFGSPVIGLDTMNLSQGKGASPQVAITKKMPRQGVLKNKDREGQNTKSDDTTSSHIPKHFKRHQRTSPLLYENTERKSEFHYQPRQDVDSVSVVSEGLDAEVTAITSSSSPGSSGSNTLQPVKTEHLTAVKVSPQQSQQKSDVDRSSSSGIASKNTSQNQTMSSHSTSGSLSQHQTSSLSPENISTLIDISDKQSSLMSPVIDLKHSPGSRVEDTMHVLYENWPPRPHQFSSPTSRLPIKQLQYVAYTPPPPITSGVPPFNIHEPGGARPRMLRGGVGSSPDTSQETPPSRGSRPNSSQSAPLDRSVDRHYEWDQTTTVDDTSLPSLPPEWSRSRRSPAYNPRRDRDIGQLAQSNRERVFSDSEIYSNVFPRRRLQMDVEARVRAMKKEFKEYRKTQNISPNDSDRLESLI
jgi:hypothetical protein